jgi:hypothetical protein
VPLYFNTAGPCRPERHYMIPALRRLPEARPLSERGFYFAVHAPWQTGKTTAIRTLAEALTASGSHAALSLSCEAGSAGRDDYAAVQGGILADLRRRAENALPPELQPPPFPEAPPLGMLRTALATWARACPRPLALFFDEIDALTGQSLEAVLRQLRAGYDDRPENFPACVVLCGMRNMRDYKAASGGRRRIDLLLRWPYRAEDGGRLLQREAMELKVWRKGEKDPLAQGLTQLDGYLTGLGLSEGTLVIFDRRPVKRGAAVRRGLRRVKSPSGRKVVLLRL